MALKEGRKRVMVNMDSELKELVDKKADAEGRSISNYIVQLIKKDLQKDSD